jgi:hypothetical protein
MEDWVAGQKYRIISQNRQQIYKAPEGRIGCDAVTSQAKSMEEATVN